MFSFFKESVTKILPTNLTQLNYSFYWDGFTINGYGLRLSNIPKNLNRYSLLGLACISQLQSIIASPDSNACNAVPNYQPRWGGWDYYYQFSANATHYVLGTDHNLAGLENNFNLNLNRCYQLFQQTQLTKFAALPALSMISCINPQYQPYSAPAQTLFIQADFLRWLNETEYPDLESCFMNQIGAFLKEMDSMDNTWQVIVLSVIGALYASCAICAIAYCCCRKLPGHHSQ